jgi:Flp pilus assembly pilin Flp
MIKIIVHLQNVAADRRERGAAMAEYGLLLALVALAAIIVLAAFGQSIKGVFTSAQTQLDAGIPAAP